MEDELQGVLLAAGAVLVWAHALYVASRSLTRRVSQLAAAAMLCLAAYLMAEALGALAPDLPSWSAWLRRTWWAPSLALPIWLVLSIVLTLEESPSSVLMGVRRWSTPVSVIVLGVGAIFAAIGVVTTAIQNWDAPFVDPLSGVRHIPAAAFLPAFQVYALVCLVWPGLNLLRRWRASPPGSPLRARLPGCSLPPSSSYWVGHGSWSPAASSVSRHSRANCCWCSAC